MAPVEESVVPAEPQNSVPVEEQNGEAELSAPAAASSESGESPTEPVEIPTNTQPEVAPEPEVTETPAEVTLENVTPTEVTNEPESPSEPINEKDQIILETPDETPKTPQTPQTKSYTLSSIFF